MIPVELPWRCIKMHTDLHGMVLDPYSGLGSTLMACDQLGRTCFGVELEPKFVDVAAERYRTAAEKPGEIYVVRDGKRIDYETIKQAMPDAE